MPLQVECKLIHVASGADVARHLPELYKHFQVIGSPIMIGKNITMVSECGGTCVDMARHPQLSRNVGQ